MQIRKAIGFRWDGVVTLGNILTLLGMIVSMASLSIGIIIWATKLEARIDRLDELRRAFEMEVRRDQARDEVSLKTIKTELTKQGERISASLDRLSDKIDRKADR